VIDEEAAAEERAGMDFNAGPEAGGLRKDAAMRRSLRLQSQ